MIKKGKKPLLLFTIILFAFLYLPILVLFIFSFNSRAFPAPWSMFTTKWYKSLFFHEELWVSFGNSCIVAGFSTFICLLLSIFMLFHLSKGGRVGNIIPLFYGNLVIPDTVLAVGLISYFTLLNIPLGLFAIIIAHSIVGLGIAVPILYTSYQDIDSRIFEASRVLGATSVLTFRKVIFPLMRPTLIAISLIIFVLSFDDFVLAYFCSGTSTQTLSLYLVSCIRFGVSPVVNALASILLLFTISLVLLFFSLKARSKIL